MVKVDVPRDDRVGGEVGLHRHGVVEGHGRGILRAEGSLADGQLLPPDPHRVLHQSLGVDGDMEGEDQSLARGFGAAGGGEVGLQGLFADAVKPAVHGADQDGLVLIDRGVIHSTRDGIHAGEIGLAAFSVW